MRVLITGGTGLIGRALADELTRAGYQVIVSSRNPTTARPFAPSVDLVRWDTQTPDGLVSVIESVDAIVNLVGESIGSGLWTRAKKERILRSRLVAGQALTAAVTRAKRKPQVVVQSSAVGYYGPRGSEHLDETTPPGGNWSSGVAVQWEASTAAIETPATRHVIIRNGIVLSTHAEILLKMMLPFRLLIGGPLGNGKQGVSWIHIADATAGIRFLIEHSDSSGPYNLTAPNPLSNAQFGRTLASVMRRPYWMPAPGPALRLVLGEKAELVLEGQLVIPRRLLEQGFEFRFPKLRPALEDLLVS